MPSARLADISSNASRASRSLSARSSPTLRRSSVDTGVRLPHQGGHGGLQIEQRIGRAGCRPADAAAARLMSTARPGHHRPVSGRPGRCRPGPGAGPHRRPGQPPERAAVEAIRPPRGLRQPKPVLLLVEADARPRRWVLRCRYPSRPCSLEPPRSPSSQKRGPAARPARTCGNRLRPPSLRSARRAGGRPKAFAGTVTAIEDARAEGVIARAADAAHASLVNPS